MSMKYILPIMALFAAVAFTSCQKSYSCHCQIDYIDIGDQRLWGSTDNDFDVEADSKDDAKLECKYYETNGRYQERDVVIKHYCDIR